MPLIQKGVFTAPLFHLLPLRRPCPDSHNTPLEERIHTEKGYLVRENHKIKTEKTERVTSVRYRERKLLYKKEPLFTLLFLSPKTTKPPLPPSPLTYLTVDQNLFP